MPSIRLRRAVAAIGAAVIAVPLLALPATATTQGRATVTLAKGTRGFHVDGNRILLDGAPFLSKGVIFEGFQFPYATMSAGSKAGKPRPCHVLGSAKDKAKVKAFCVRHLNARDYYFGRHGRPDALDLAITNWHANTVRLNLNQAALDPKSPLWNAKGGPPGERQVAYREEIHHAVTVAESKGMVVELALFTSRLDAADEVTYGGRTMPQLNPPSPLPTGATKRAMQTLAKEYGADRSVLIELYNEPGTSHYDVYLNGGGDGHVGVLPILASVDKLVKNPIVVQGLQFTLKGFPFGKLKDQNVIYAVHPFLSNGTAADVNFDARFGNAAAKHPVLLTAWDATPKKKGGSNTWCTAPTNPAGLALAANLLAYVRDHHIGLSGFAFDVPFSMTRNFAESADKADQFSGSCSSKGHAGGIIQNLFGQAGYTPPA